MKDNKTQRQNAPAIYLYALIPGGTGPVPPGLTGVGGAEVRLADSAGLTAVVSDVGLEEFGAQPLRQNLEDLTWLESVARAHHGVIDALARLGTLLPMRLATVYTSEESMAAGVAAHAERFRDALEWLRSRTEWGVKAYLAAAVKAAGSRDVPPGSATDGGAAADSNAEGSSAEGSNAEGSAGSGSMGTAGTGRDVQAGTGLSYLRRRREALSASRESARRAADAARAIHAELARYAVECRLHAPQSPQLSGRSETMVTNAAYLLDDDRAGDFATAVEALAEQNPRLSLELTGPWPPYSFAAQELSPFHPHVADPTAAFPERSDEKGSLEQEEEHA